MTSRPKLIVHAIHKDNNKVENPRLRLRLLKFKDFPYVLCDVKFEGFFFFALSNKPRQVT